MSSVAIRVLSRPTLLGVSPRATSLALGSASAAIAPALSSSPASKPPGRSTSRVVASAPGLRASAIVTRSSAVMAAAAGSDSGLLFRQLFDAQFGSSTYTYLLADAGTKEAVLIDPVLELVDRDLALIEQLGLKLKYAINTHCHADHITGTGEIKKRQPHVKSGIAKASGAKADIFYEHGDTISFGGHQLKVLATPGHTSGCICFYTTSAGGLAFTGDALLIRGCGRTDFQGGSAETLFQSVHEQLFTLPDATTVYPAHDYKGQTASSIGEEKAFNPRLSKSKAEFVDIMANLNLPYPKKIGAHVTDPPTMLPPLSMLPITAAFPVRIDGYHVSAVPLHVLTRNISPARWCLPADASLPANLVCGIQD
mmetsp:Transcript_24929/g.62823  ORF Transcript_24929/g.62823 Transcript_24929/m.62823 type:complete len:368 (-) Transcript_24929:244-1347(-)